MCSKEELLRQLLIKVSFMTDEDVQKMLEYAKRELDETAEKETSGKEKEKAQRNEPLGLFMF